MKGFHRKQAILFVGDVLVLVVSLWVTLALRYFALPSSELLSVHVPLFLFLLPVSLVVFYIAGLYEQQLGPFFSETASLLLRSQIANAIITAVFFYFVPSFGIAPKTNLFLYLITSFALLCIWRFGSGSLTGAARKERALLAGAGNEMGELYDVVQSGQSYAFSFVSRIDLSALSATEAKQAILDAVKKENISIIVADLSHEKIGPILPDLYELLLNQVSIISLQALYEAIFERVPLDTLTYRWFLEHVVFDKVSPYDVLKRIMDMILSLPVGALFLISFPFVWIATKLQDGGTVWSLQERVGQDGKTVLVYKFRTMDRDYRGGWVKDSDKRVTPVGRFLRKARIDELPQFWNVLLGDLSFIGPRPDVIGNYEHLVKELPYYRMRSLVKPGLSGWAQVKQELPPQSLEETRVRLAYDFYYVKNRSLMLDIRIALRTIKTLLSRAGI